jgi:hypothetical protein
MNPYDGIGDCGHPLPGSHDGKMWIRDDCPACFYSSAIGQPNTSAKALCEWEQGWRAGWEEAINHLTIYGGPECLLVAEDMRNRFTTKGEPR